MKNTFDRTVYSLCLEIDELKEEVKYWREKYEEEKNANAKMLDENLAQAKQGVANALRFALSVQDDEDRFSGLSGKSMERPTIIVKEYKDGRKPKGGIQFSTKWR